MDHQATESQAEGAATSGAQILATGAGHYLHWGVVQISVANLIVIGVMVLLFVLVLALVVPFPGHRSRRTPEDRR